MAALKEHGLRRKAEEKSKEGDAKDKMDVDGELLVRRLRGVQEPLTS